MRAKIALVLLCLFGHRGISWSSVQAGGVRIGIGIPIGIGVGPAYPPPPLPYYYGYPYGYPSATIPIRSTFNRHRSICSQHQPTCPGAPVYQQPAPAPQQSYYTPSPSGSTPKYSRRNLPPSLPAPPSYSCPYSACGDRIVSENSIT